jgi:valyl-tRNA synthetase
VTGALHIGHALTVAIEVFLFSLSLSFGRDLYAMLTRDIDHTNAFILLLGCYDTVA